MCVCLYILLIFGLCRYVSEVSVPRSQLMITLFGVFDQDATGNVLIFFPLNVGSEGVSN